MAARPGEDDGTIKRVRDVLKRIRDAAPLIDSDPTAFNEAVEEIGRRLQEATGSAGEIELHISTNRISYNDDEVFKSESRTANLAFDIFRQGLRRLTFKPGLTGDEVHAFIVAFAENRSADQIDEDFVSTLWREPLPNITYIAIDGFTEKIFMSEERFTGAFRGVIDDLMPGLVGLSEEDPGDDAPRTRTTVDEEAVADRADLDERKLRRALPAETGAIAEGLKEDGLLVTPTERTMELLGRLMVKHPSPLPDEDLHRVVVRVLAAWLENEDWQRFADHVRSIRALVEAADRLSPALAERIDILRDAIAGREMVAHLAHHIQPENTDFTAWSRWHFATAKVLTAPELLELIDACKNPAGAAFLKDLLRRQGTESLDPWAERLRDPNPGVVLEVIEVIVGSDLSEQARPLLMDTMKHPAPEVRAAAAEGLAGAYDLAVREALLPFLKDPSSVVRRAVVSRFLAAADKSVAPYLASTIKADIFPGFDEDEQRLYFETLARLGGARFLNVFEQALGLEEQSGDLLSRFFKRSSQALMDTPTRRGAVSGLAILGSREAIALIRRVHARADLGLAAHCDVVLRLAARGEAAGEAPVDALPPKSRPLEDVEVGRTRLGDRVVFSVDTLARTGPTPPRPEGAPARTDAPSAPAGEAVSAPSAAPAAVDAPSAGPAPAPPEPPRPGAPPPLVLGDRPLLNATERYLPTDVMRLELDLTALEGSSLQLIEARIELTGHEEPQVRRSRPSTRPGRVVPGRIVEKKATRPKHVDYAEHNDFTDWSKKPAARLDDILADYLGQAVESAAPAAAAPEPLVTPQPLVADPRNEDDFRRLLDLDAITHGEIPAIKSPPAAESVVERAGDPSIVAPSSERSDKRESVEALLKDYLALGADLGGDASATDDFDDSLSQSEPPGPEPAEPDDDEAQVDDGPMELPDDAIMGPAELPDDAIMGPADVYEIEELDDDAIELIEDDLLEDDDDPVEPEAVESIEAEPSASVEAVESIEVEPSASVEAIESIEVEPSASVEAIESIEMAPLASVEDAGGVLFAVDPIEAPEDVIEAPEDVIEAPEDVIEAPEDAIEAPAGVIEAPADAIEAPEGAIEAPEDAIAAPEDAIAASAGEAAPGGEKNKAVEDLLKDFLAFDLEG